MKTGIIKVLKVNDNADGSCSIDFEVDDNFIKYYKKETGEKRATKKGISKFVGELIRKGVEKLDGYDIKSTKTK